MESRQRQLVLGGLVVAHVVGGVVAACFVKLGPNIAWFIFTGLIQTQVGLLATWAGLSTMKWPWRLLGTMIGASWLSGLIAVVQVWPYTLRSLPASLLQVALPLFLILVVLVPVRLGGLTLRLTSSAGTDKAVGGTQFSIQTLLVLTATVAVALAIYDVTSRISVLHQQAALFSIRRFVWRIRGSFLALSWATAGGNAGGDSIIVLKWNVLWRSTKYRWPLL